MEGNKPLRLSSSLLHFKFTRTQNLKSHLLIPTMTTTRNKTTHPSLLRQLLLLLLVTFTTITSSSSTTSPIKTVVVVVMENRSFDHMLGWMKRLNPTIDGVTGSESNPTSTTDPTSTRVVFDDKANHIDPNPSHSYEAIREQVFGSKDTSAQIPPMNGFVQQALGVDPSGKMSRNVMSGFGPDMVAVYRELVSEFVVFDRWFASVPASTHPNRLFVHSATSHGATSNNAGLLLMGYPQRTIFDNIHDSGLSFGVYYQQLPTVLFYRNLRKLKYISKFHNYHGTFKKHARRGSLPNYTVIEQRYLDSIGRPANDDHPSHDVYEGQMFIKDVYETLRSSPQWNESLLIITYDEHGGFYDHVPTPKAGVPSPDGIVGQKPFEFQFDRLGVRVPTIMVSPWIDKGTVVHGPNGIPFPTSEFEHSSIPATVKKIFNLQSPFLTKRDEWAGTFEGCLQKRSEPRTDCPAQLPTPLRIRKGEANEKAELSDFQEELMELTSVLNGDAHLKNFKEKVIKPMNVGEGRDYMENAVNRFFEAGYSARKMGVGGEHIVEMRPSLTTRIKPSTR